MPAAAHALDADASSTPVFLDVGRFTASNRRRLSARGLRTFLAIADLWGLDEGRRRLVLGLPSRPTYYGWVRAVREHRELTLDVDTLIRISAALGMHQALGALHDREEAGLVWLRTAHGAPTFGGRPPIDLVVSGTQDGLLTVRRFLEAARGGLYMPPNELDRDSRPHTDADVVLS